MYFTTSLTVAQSKRLIAKALVQAPVVQRALTDGWVVVCPGTTNGYIVEELLNQSIDKSDYVTGRTLPIGYDGPTCGKKRPDVVLKEGVPVDFSIADVLGELKAGDVFIKGANAINYDANEAGVLIGHPAGGTLGAALGTIIAKRVHLIHPVGLEKSVPGDLNEAAAVMKSTDGQGPTLWVSPGALFTEIEALALLADVDAIPVGAGGVGGAEGAIWFTIVGEEDAIAKARMCLDSLKDEPPFLP
jgi:hypothetical protein